ncbi:MAG: hypothetical protein JKY95_01285 [Planctomycetaceae bacterium]|nr:hypothetical protein [Planctomycetaceae bacterium]
MISTIGRVFTVLVAMSSVAFMSFAISRWVTIPDRASEARQLDEFTLTKTEGETPSWSAAKRLSGESVSTSINMSEVLEAMYKRGTQDAQTELTLHQEEIPFLEKDIAAAKASIEQDTAAVVTRAEQLLAQMKQLDELVDKLTTDAEREKAVAQKTQQTRERRRSDVYRVREEIAEVVSDKFRASQLKSQLTDMVRRVQGNVVKLQTRQQQLKESLQ